MSRHPVKLPDVGEGVAEAELVSWLVEVGDTVTSDSPLAEVLTDKATVEISCPVAGVVAGLNGEPGDVIAVGSELAIIETDSGSSSEVPADEVDDDPSDDEAIAAAADGADGEAPAPEAHSDEDEADDEAEEVQDGPEVVVEPEIHVEAVEDGSDPAAPPTESSASPDATPGPASGSSPLAAPAVRARARDLGIDLTSVDGSGPDGRVLHADLDGLLTGGRRDGPARSRSDQVEVRQEPVRGLRRRIAERLSAAWTEIPHITFVESIDATELEVLRAQLNRDEGAPHLTLLPFMVRAIAMACREQPRLNAHYDRASEMLSVSAAVHVGVATQTDDGLMVPVVRHAEDRSLRDLAVEIGRVTADARSGRATREQLSGSTITITSLGALGGVATTPILNAPEVAIIGINRLEMRPVWRDGSFQPRRVFNLSSSFDHRMVDGWDAATFVQRIRTVIETPALLFIGDGEA